ncbi:MAG: hypothetical protein WEE89_22510 [Gemmatimonadota bacterium]
MRAPLLASTLIIIIASTADAQSVWDRWHLRHNNQTRKEVAQPAFASAMIPDSAEATYSVGIGLSVDFKRGNKLTASAGLDFQRNTAIDKKQNAVSAEILYDYTPMNFVSSGWSPIFFGKAGLKSDRVKDTESASGSAMATAIFAGSGPPNTQVRLPLNSMMIYAPSIGLAADRIVSAHLAEAEGTILRAVYQLDLNIYPFSSDRVLEVAGAIAYRQDLSDDTSEADDWHPFRKVDVTYYFVRFYNPARTEVTRSIGFGITLVSGENPDQGLADQRYLQIGLKARLK